MNEARRFATRFLVFLLAAVVVCVPGLFLFVHFTEIAATDYKIEIIGTWLIAAGVWVLALVHALKR